MIYPVIVKKVFVPSMHYWADNGGVRYIAFSPLTETICAVSDNVQDVLKKITSEFALRVFDNQIELDVIMVDENQNHSYEVFNS